MSEDHSETTARPKAGDEELSGYAPLDKQLSQGVLRGDAGTERAQVFICAFLIVAAGLLAFHPALNIPLNGPDLEALTAEGHFDWFAQWPAAMEAVPEGPLSVFGLALNHFGPVPFMLYLGALVIHVAGGVALYFLARRLVPGVSEAVAMVAGLLYVCHPVAVESVAVLTQRSGIQGASLALIASCLYLRAISAPALKPYALAAALACYAAAAASHFALTPVPIVWLAWLRTREPRPAPPGTAIAAGLPLLLMAAVAVARRAAPGAVTGNGSSWPVVAGQGFLDSLLRLAVLRAPAPLPAEAAAGLLGAAILAVLLLAAIALSWRRFSAGPPLLWFALATVSAAWLADGSRLLVGAHHVAAWAAVPLLVVLLLQKAAQPGVRAGLGIAATAVILAGALFSYHHTSRWVDPSSLWLQAADQNDGPRRVAALFHAGDYALDLANRAEDTDAAERWLEDAAMPLRLAHEAAETPEEKARAAATYGVTLARAGNHDAAFPVLESAVRLDPFQAEAALYLALAAETRGLAGGDRNTLSAAREYFARAAALAPLPPAAAMRHASLLLNAYGDFEGALQTLAPHADEPELAGQLQQIQTVFAQMKQLEATAAETASRNPQDMNALLQVVEARMSLGRIQSSFYMLDRILLRDPDNDNAWIRMGMLQAQMGNADGFLREWGEGRTGDWAPWAGLVQATARAGLWEQALAYGQEGARRTEDAPDVRMLLGRTALDMRQAARAEAFFRAVTEDAPEDPDPWLGLADLALAQNNEAAAAGFLQEAEARGADPDAIEGRGAPTPAPTPETAPPSRPGIERTVIR